MLFLPHNIHTHHVQKTRHITKHTGILKEAAVTILELVSSLVIQISQENINYIDDTEENFVDLPHRITRQFYIKQRTPVLVLFVFVFKIAFVIFVVIYSNLVCDVI